ncbi:hypothetical protein TIFTF001_042961 [Ficus carica]|uniref:Uncharacterized protein n=1 Tax=Ficus carica TaxID=3494 RepID=A0AA88CVY4_FICCA|nr:hypothetical protein TIFTF001_042961 [Ficus carica]
MSNVLQKQHEEHQTARQIMDNLEEMFGEQTIQAKTDAIKGLMNCRQKGWNSHQGAHDESHGLLASYNLNRKEMSLTELMKELQAFENIFKGSGSKAEVNMAAPSSPAPNPKRKRKRGRTRGTSLR